MVLVITVAAVARAVAMAILALAVVPQLLRSRRAGCYEKQGRDNNSNYTFGLCHNQLFNGIKLDPNVPRPAGAVNP